MWHQRKKLRFLKKAAILGTVTELGILYTKAQRRNQIINEVVRYVLLYKTGQGSFCSSEAKCHKLICPYCIALGLWFALGSMWCPEVLRYPYF